MQGGQQGVHESAVPRLGQAVSGGRRGEPEDAVDLGVRGEGAPGGLGRPVADLLGAAVREVARGGQRGAGRGPVAGFLLDLAQRAGEGFLAALQLALGPGPVVV